MTKLFKILILLAILTIPVIVIGQAVWQWVPSQRANGVALTTLGTMFNFSNSSTGGSILAIDTSDPQVTVTGNLSVSGTISPATTIFTTLTAATANIGFSKATAVGMYVGSTVSQTFVTGTFEVGTAQDYITSSGTVITHSATFTRVPTMTFGIIPNASNSSTHYVMVQQVTPTTAVCTAVVYKMTIADATHPVYAECTSGEVSLTWMAIGK